MSSFKRVGFFLYYFQNVGMLDSPSPGWMRRRQKGSGLVQKALRSKIERIAPVITVIDIPQVHENLFGFIYCNILNYVKRYQKIKFAFFRQCLTIVLFKI